MRPLGCRALFFALGFLYAALAGAHERGPAKPEPKESEPASMTLLPVGGYAPETSVALGAVFVKLWPRRAVPEGETSEALEPPVPLTPKARPSSLALLALGTLRKQLITEVQGNLGFGAGASGIWGKLEYQYIPDKFFGIGNQTPRDGEPYVRELVRARIWPQVRVLGPLHAGVFAELHVFHGEYPAGSALFDEQRVPGMAGGRSVGVGGTLTYDTRDNALATQHGGLIELTVVPHARSLGSHYAFLQSNLDALWFQPLVGAHLIALRAHAEALSGAPPFYMLAQLGGPDLLRGYYRGRFRDRCLASLEIELRTGYLWRLGGALFAGVGRVAKSLSAFDLQEVHPAGGAGLRFALLPEQHLNLRLDAAFGTDSHGVYVGIMEAF